MTDTPRLLIVSLSPLAQDARVLKQIRHYANRYRVTTCGFGPSPHPDVEHLEIARTSPRATRLRAVLSEGRTVLRRYRRLYWSNDDVRAADRLLDGRSFDLAIANDLDTVPLVLRHVDGEAVHADLHEYWPLLHEERPRWRRFRAPYYAWLCRTYVTRVASVTTVSPGIAAAYSSNFGFETDVVLNATPSQPLSPRPVGETIKLVFSGAADPSRGIETIIAAAGATRADVTLDLFLMPGPPEYMAELERAAASAGPRVTIHPPQPYDRLVAALNQFDVGVYLPSGRGFNHLHALPNKLFDFAQARLGVIVGPTPEIAALVEETGIGVVTPGPDTADLIAVLDELRQEQVASWKARADAVADSLSAERQQHVWDAALARIVARRARAAGTAS